MWRVRWKRGERGVRRSERENRNRGDLHMVPEINVTRYLKAVKRSSPVNFFGKVTKVVGLIIEGYAPAVSVGGTCYIYPKGSTEPILAEVVGFRDRKALLMPLGDLRGVSLGSLIVARKAAATVRIGSGMLGRIMDGLGEPIDGQGPIEAEDERPIYVPPINPLERKRIDKPLDIGIKAIDGLLRLGQGQRIGIMSGSGVGKSVLLGMIARYASADVNVIALIGERGREVRDFIEKDLGPEGLKRSVVVAATSDQSPLVRMRGAFMATAIAEYFRTQNASVLLMMDSITRFAMAQREVGLAVGEPPTTRGYTPSVFALLPRLLERAGAVNGGSITGLYSVLVEADDINDPISDAVRSIVDGHIVLSRDLANRNHYPSIDVLGSISRIMRDIVSPEHSDLAHRLRTVMATYQSAEDLINIGAYNNGSNPTIDYAIKKIGEINEFLVQQIECRVDFKEALAGLEKIFGQNGSGASAGGNGTVRHDGEAPFPDVEMNVGANAASMAAGEGAGADADPTPPGMQEPKADTIKEPRDLTQQAI